MSRGIYYQEMIRLDYAQCAPGIGPDHVIFTK